MTSNYYIPVILTLFLFPIGMTSQEIQIFKMDDFDLKGKVKTCLVSTDYGKEEYEFDASGFLAKSTTRYNDADYDITYYKYDQGNLLEKRLENYRDNTFDSATSIANIYTIDSTSNLKITERILSYDKEFLDQYEYYYTNDTLRKIVRSNNDGIDETQINYANIKGEQTTTYKLNGVTLKSIRTSVKKEKDSVVAKNVLIKKFIDGKPTTATEEIFDGRNNITSSTKFYYSASTKQFAAEEIVKYQYDESGMLTSSLTTVGNQTEEREYIYQLDVNKNWIKEIITPENAYKTRNITYFEMASATVVPE